MSTQKQRIDRRDHVNPDEGERKYGDQSEPVHGWNGYWNVVYRDNACFIFARQ